MDTADFYAALQLQGKVSNDHYLVRKLNAEAKQAKERDLYRQSPAFKFKEILNKKYPIYYFHNCLKKGEKLEAYFCISDGHFNELGEGYKNNSRKLLNLAVHQDRRGAGIGTKILRDICNAGDEAGCLIEVAAFPFRMDFGKGYEQTISGLVDYTIGFLDNVSFNDEEQKEASLKLAAWYKRFGFENVRIPAGANAPKEWAKDIFLARFPESSPAKYLEMMKRYRKANCGPPPPSKQK